jgi:hypothetical protein
MRTCSITLSLIVATAASAQDRPTPEAALAAKLESPFLQLADWCTDYEAALVTAGRRETLIFGYFTTANY